MSLSYLLPAWESADKKCQFRFFKVIFRGQNQPNLSVFLKKQYLKKACHMLIFFLCFEKKYKSALTAIIFESGPMAQLLPNGKLG